jgi:hypothetical protein
MSLSLKQLLSDYQNFDSYLLQFGEDPKLFPITVEKFIKLAKIAAEKDMLNPKEKEFVYYKNFADIVKSANSFEDMLEKYTSDLKAALYICSYKSTVYEEAYDKLKSTTEAHVVPQVQAEAVQAEAVQTHLTQEALQEAVQVARKANQLTQKFFDYLYNIRSHTFDTKIKFRKYKEEIISNIDKSSHIFSSNEKTKKLVDDKFFEISIELDNIIRMTTGIPIYTGTMSDPEYYRFIINESVNVINTDESNRNN